MIGDAYIHFDCLFMRIVEDIKRPYKFFRFKEDCISTDDVYITYWDSDYTSRKLLVLSYLNIGLRLKNEIITYIVAKDDFVKHIQELCYSHSDLKDNIFESLSTELNRYISECRFLDYVTGKELYRLSPLSKTL